MNEDEKTEGQVEVRVDGAKKELPPRWINVNIKMVDGHYLVTFRHEVTRIFHNMHEVLRAIEVEINRLHG